MARLSINELRQLAQKYDAYEVVAIRTQETPFTLGEMTHQSKVWIDGNETDDNVGGVCATDIDSYGLKMHSSESDTYSGFYFGDHQAIIAGYRYQLGVDDGEVIIYDPVVVEILS